MKQLRPYQKRAADFVRFREKRDRQVRLALAAPTGSGKTVIMTELLRDPCRQIVISHRKILIDQISAELTAQGIPHGFRASGRKPNPDAPIQLAMIQTELKRAGKMALHDAARVHIDEIHCQGGPQYRAIFSQYRARGAAVIGYTATPSDLGDMVDDVFPVATVPELIQQGYLCQPRVFSCGMPDPKLLEQLRRDAYGEFLSGDVEKLVKPQIICGRVLEQLRRLNPDGRPFVLFAHSVAASIWWARHLTIKGYPTAHIDGNDIWVDGAFYKSDSAKRKECFERIESGNLKGLSNRFVLREGVDLPILGHAILTAPVGTRQGLVQMCGRVLRPYAGREYAVIQDHSGSCLNHPMLDSNEPWDWQMKSGLAERIRIAEMREDVIPEPIVCPKCMGVRAAGDTCPYCGYRYPKRARFVIQTDGTLTLIEGKTYKPRPIKRVPGQAEQWEKLYWGTIKKNSNRTAEQVYAYHAYNNGWKWLPRDLPLMPRSQANWFMPLKDIPKSDLIPKAETTAAF